MDASFEFGIENESDASKKVHVEIKTWKSDDDGRTQVTERFDLADDVTGVEILEVIAGNGSARSAALFLRRIVKAEDWERFSQSTKGASPQALGEMVGKLIDEYAGFPITREAVSSGG